MNHRDVQFVRRPPARPIDRSRSAGAADTPASPRVPALTGRGARCLAVLAALAVIVGAPAAAQTPAAAQPAAAEFRSIGVPAAVMYDGPSLKGRKAFIAPRGMPVEVLSTLGNWVKVRDLIGDVLWVDRKDLTVQRTVIATTSAAVRNGATDNSPILFVAERGVVLELSEVRAPAGWARVRHRDGTIGYARAADVWGL
ncbi:MAG TPA: SH3 domain-containing protein [Burkholderiaceae bacterium]|nr:SH3 domain-containing protein [Burkholderiaceae bacterium]